MKSKTGPDLVNRRAALELFGALGLLAIGCGGGSTTDAIAGSSGTTGDGGTTDTDGGTGTGTITDGGTSTATGDGSTTNAACNDTPAETAGPYPDKTGMLGNTTYERADVTEGKAGVPLALELIVATAGGACAPIAGATVMIWQCDAAGNYSEYSQPGYDGSGQTFLRGYQTTDASGKVTFSTIFPGWYNGRATHIHVDVRVNGKSVKTTQIAFPEDVQALVYASSAYVAHGQSPLKNSADMVFSDGDAEELIAVSGDTTSGYAGSLTIGVA
jgi:protocatechuate 3,4-dioxygenase beta subunit